MLSRIVLQPPAIMEARAPNLNVAKASGSERPGLEQLAEPIVRKLDKQINRI
jgi:hypothetical protein